MVEQIPGEDALNHAHLLASIRIAAIIATLLLGLAWLLPITADGSLAGMPAICLFYQLTHVPCPACGLSRALAAATHLQCSRSLAFHPLGVPGALILMGMVVTGILSLLLPASVLQLAKHLGLGSHRQTAVTLGWATRLLLVLMLALWVLRLAGLLPSLP